MSALRKCETKVAEITRQICDVTKYIGKSEARDAAYRDFGPYRSMFIKHLLRETSASTCFGGWLHLMLPETETGKFLPAFIDRAPNLNKCRGTKKYDTVVYETGYTHYELNTLHAKEYKKLQTIRAKDAYLETKKSQGGHATVLIIDHRQRMVEYFDPNGAISETVQVVIKTLKTWVNRHYPSYSFSEEPSGSCPRLGPQWVAGDARCANWSLLHIYLRIFCSGLTSRRLQTYLTGRGGKYLKKLMSGWICFMWGYAKEKGLITMHDEIKQEIRRAERSEARFKNKISLKAVEATRVITAAYTRHLSFLSGQLEL